MSFYEFDHRNLVVFGEYVNLLRLKIVRSDKRATTLKWIRSLMTAYYLFIAYYGLFELDFASISHPNWRNLKNHWWKCITVWNVVLQVRYFIMSFLIDHKDTLPKKHLIRQCITMGKNVQDYCFITLDVPSSIGQLKFYDSRSLVFYTADKTIRKRGSVDRSRFWRWADISALALFVSLLLVCGSLGRQFPVFMRWPTVIDSIIRKHVNMFVCCLFWLIQILNRPLFFPKEMNVWIPNWYNHAVHTYPLFVIVFQMFSHFHQNPPVKPAVLGLCLHSSVYIACILYTRWSTGQWIYLVIGEIVQNIPQAVMLLLLTGFAFPIIILLLCYKLNGFIWTEKTE